LIEDEIIEEQVDIGDLVFDKGGDDEDILYGDGNYEILIVRKKLIAHSKR
jgi:hypothetical protein